MAQLATDWRHRAACRDFDPELFFPVTEEGPGAKQVARAKSVCARCPVLEQCLSFAIENGLDDGIFGGATASERRSMARRSRLTA